MGKGQQNDSGFVTHVCGEALEANRRVKIEATASSPSKVVYADASERSIGVTHSPEVGKIFPTVEGDRVTIKHWSAPGTHAVEVAAAVATPGLRLYPANDGKLTPTAGGQTEYEAIAMDTATGSGSVIEVAGQYGDVGSS